MKGTGRHVREFGFHSIGGCLQNTGQTSPEPWGGWEVDEEGLQGGGGRGVRTPGPATLLGAQQLCYSLFYLGPS